MRNSRNSKLYRLEAIDPETTSPSCPNCGATITGSDHFCGHCGKEIIVDDNPHWSKGDVFSILTPTLVYYFSTLVLLAAYKLTPLFPEGFEGLVAVTVIDVLFVIAFWIFSFRALKPLFSFSNVRVSTLLLTVLGALLGSALITVVANAIQVSIQDDVFYSTYLFQDTRHPILYSVLFICVQPAIFEEVAFRGFLFTNLQSVTSSKGAIYITGFLFGVIHLAFISLLWLVPIGLIFAFLRLKYNTLWYGIIGHFTYNFGITAIEFFMAK